MSYIQLQAWNQCTFLFSLNSHDESLVDELLLIINIFLAIIFKMNRIVVSGLLHNPLQLPIPLEHLLFYWNLY